MFVGSVKLFNFLADPSNLKKEKLFYIKGKTMTYFNMFYFYQATMIIDKKKNNLDQY